MTRTRPSHATKRYHVEVHCQDGVGLGLIGYYKYKGVI